MQTCEYIYMDTKIHTYVKYSAYRQHYTIHHLSRQRQRQIDRKTDTWQQIKPRKDRDGGQGEEDEVPALDEYERIPERADGQPAGDEHRWEGINY